RPRPNRQRRDKSLRTGRNARPRTAHRRGQRYLLSWIALLILNKYSQHPPSSVVVWINDFIVFIVVVGVI
ncbi:unnamed protein product, partial [Ascophyllum nodosum]